MDAFTLENLCDAKYEKPVTIDGFRQYLTFTGETTEYLEFIVDVKDYTTSYHAWKAQKKKLAKSGAGRTHSSTGTNGTSSIHGMTDGMTDDEEDDKDLVAASQNNIAGSSPRVTDWPRRRPT